MDVMWVSEYASGVSAQYMYYKDSYVVCRFFYIFFVVVFVAEQMNSSILCVFLACVWADASMWLPHKAHSFMYTPFYREAKYYR